MENNRYPKYCDGHILTSRDLNESFDFLHQQVKETRRLLFGYGILNGLNYRYNPEKSSITIFAGMAITKAGSIIRLEKDTVYRCAKEEKKEFLLSEKDGDPINDIKNIYDYYLGIRVKYEDQLVSYASEKTCTIEGNEVVIRLQPYLTHKDSLKKTTVTADKFIEELDLVPSEGIVNFRVLPIFLRRAGNRFEEKIQSVIKGIEKIRDFSSWKDVLPNDNTQFKSECKEAISQLEVISFDCRKLQIYYAFADDMFKAVEEFIAFYNYFVSRYNNVSLENEDNIILGKITNESYEKFDSRYSHQEIYCDNGRIIDEMILRRLFKRIVLMPGNFKPDDSQPTKEGDIIVPSSVGANLGERPFPSYYDAASDLREYWDAHKEYHIETTEKFKASDFRKADLYLLTGYEDTDTTSLENKLKAEILKYNLPVLVLKHELIGRDISFDLENFRRDKAVNAYKTSSEEIVDLLIEKSEIFGDDDRSELENLFTGVLDCLNEFDFKKAAKILEKYVAEGGDVKADNQRSSAYEEIRQAFYLLNKKNCLTDNHRKIFDFVMISYLHATEEEALFNAMNMQGVDYIGGVEKKDSILLVTFKDKTLLCMDIPFINLIANEDIYKDQIKDYLKDIDTNFIKDF